MHLRICIYVYTDSIYVCQVCERSFYISFCRLNGIYTKDEVRSTRALQERIQYIITGQFLLLIKLFLNRKSDPVSLFHDKYATIIKRVD